MRRAQNCDTQLHSDNLLVEKFLARVRPKTFPHCISFNAIYILKYYTIHWNDSVNNFAFIVNINSRSISLLIGVNKSAIHFASFMMNETDSNALYTQSKQTKCVCFEP